MKLLKYIKDLIWTQDIEEDVVVEPCIVCGHNCIWCTIEKEVKDKLTQESKSDVTHSKPMERNESHTSNEPLE